MTILEHAEQDLIDYFIRQDMECDSIIDNGDTLIVYIARGRKMHILAMSEICFRRGVDWKIMPSIQKPECIAIWITEKK